MRRTVGILGLSIGVLLPILAAVLSECYIVQASISHYYYTIAGDVFVGLLCAVAFFLFFIRGTGSGRISGQIAGILPLCIAFFPTFNSHVSDVCTTRTLIYPAWVSTVYLISAGAFFIILGVIALLQFPQVMIPSKIIRTEG